MHSHRKRPLVGVIDIGSNSVRLVVYDGIKRVPLALFNEKHHCGLGSGIQKTGKLGAKAKAETKRTLTRFAQLVHQMELEHVFAVATAAIRDAKDGAVFAQELTEAIGISIKVISGEEEARLAAMGILASIYKPQGIAGDLGGGSLELVEISERKISGAVSHPLGALRLLDAYGKDVEAMRHHVRHILESVACLRRSHKHFYAIGGGFRTVAAVHMRHVQYPLRIMHGYCLTTEVLLPYLESLLAMSDKDRNALDGIPSRREDVFLPSIVILQEIIRATGVEKVVFSASGIREGLIYDRLSAKLQKEKALTASMRNMLGAGAADKDYAAHLFDWLEPLMVGEKDIQRLMRKTMCALGDISLPVHPEFRADWAFEHIIQSSLWGISHRQRVMLALALYHRYRRKWKREDAVLSLLSERNKLWAALSGQAASLAFEISGGVVEQLEQFTLQADKSGKLQLKGSKEALSMLPAAIEKRLEGLSDIFKAYSSLFK